MHVRYNIMSPHCFILILIHLLCLILTTNASAPTNELHHQFMDKQNQARKAVGLNRLVWSDTLARYAGSYAGQRREDCALEHSNGPYGENIFWGSGDEWTPDQAAAAWVDEGQWYDYGSNSCAEEQQCGHYTQIVWRNTSKIGCARVVCDDDKGVFMTCNYDPPGNYYGERPY
ncbi:Cuticle-degrading protease [Orobanche minor]